MLQLRRPLTLLALASLPLGCPDDPVPTETNGDSSSSTGDDPSTTMTTTTMSSTTMDPDSSSSDATTQTTTTMTTGDTDESSSSSDATESSSSTDPTDATESSSSTDPTKGTESSSSTDPTDPTTGGSSSESGTVSCAETDLGNTVPTSVAFDTTMASNDFVPSCQAVSNTGDLTYSWTAPVAGTYFVTTSRTATNFDTVVTVLDGCEGAELACDDDAGVSTTSYVQVTLVADQEILIIVDGYNLNAGMGELYIDAVPAAGDGGSCCTEQVGVAGCDAPPVEQCVCGFDQACCDTEWTANCGDEAVALCNAECEVVPPPACIEPQVGTCQDPNDDCVCVGCNDDGVCGLDDDCTCDDCAAETFCTGDGCTDDGSCDPYEEGCSCVDCADEDVCLGGGVPAEWTCNAIFYGDGDCDCGCGALDVDCADATVASCEFCNDTGSCNTEACPGTIDPDDNSTCEGGVPAEWTCSPTFYGADDGCDCGCGAVDPDCADATLASCEFCDDTGSCSDDVCPGTIDATDNSTCTGGGGESEALVAGPALGLAVTDDAYTGALASMQCATLPLVANGTDNVTGGQLAVAMSHTWVGDLTIKVVSPSGTVVTVLSRPGMVELDDGAGSAGDSSNLAVAFPLTYVNGGATDAELMGSTLTTSQVVCQNDGLCAYDPNPGAAVPAGDFSAFAGESAVGNWQVCFADSAGGDTGTVDQITLTIDQN